MPMKFFDVKTVWTPVFIRGGTQSIGNRRHTTHFLRGFHWTISGEQGVVVCCWIRAAQRGTRRRHVVQRTMPCSLLTRNGNLGTAHE